MTHICGSKTSKASARSISASGRSDDVVLREFDLKTKTFVPDGFSLPEAKCNAGWVEQDTLLLGSAHGEGMATPSGYARTVRLWRRGDNVDQARIIFEAQRA